MDTTYSGLITEQNGVMEISVDDPYGIFWELQVTADSKECVDEFDAGHEAQGGSFDDAWNCLN